MAAVAIRRNNQRLMEVSYASELVVDRDAGVIRGVKILGRESANGRTYSDQAMREAAILYDGRGVNLDHDRTGKERKVAEGFGRIDNATVRPDGVYGDLEFLKSHPAAEQVCEAAERMPEQLGMSHDAEGTVIRQNGRMVVESITSVNFVDMVRKPATNAGLFESQGGTQMTLLQEQADLLPPEAEAAVEEPVEAGPTPADEVKAARDKAAMAILKRALDGAIMLKDALKQITEVVGKLDGAMVGMAGPEEAPAEEETEPAIPESIGHRRLDPSVVKLQEKVSRLEREAAARDLLEAKDIEAKASRISALIAARNTEEQHELLEDWPQRSSGMHASRPAQSSPLYRLRENVNEKYPDTHEGFLRSIK